MVENILHPCTLFFHDVIASTCIFELPLIIELTNKTKFCRHRWNTKLVKSPIVLVTPKSQSHYFFTCAFHRSNREWCISWNLGENLHNTWTTVLNIILLSTIEWINESITIWMNVNDEGEFLLMARQEVFERLGFWLRESWWTSKIGVTRIQIGCFCIRAFTSYIINSVHITLIVNNIINLTKIYSKVSVEINSAIDLCSRRAPECRICILSFWHNSLILNPVRFDISWTINVENWHEVILVLCKKLFVIWILLHEAKLN